MNRGERLKGRVLNIGHVAPRRAVVTIEEGWGRSNGLIFGDVPTGKAHRLPVGRGATRPTTQFR
jgi:hypothetical protein